MWGKNMFKYLIKRLAVSIIILFGVSIIIYFVVRM
ncbi:MAG TPA: diguanylate cyclase, partial [Lachnoclostridium phytofermentans]|nr:diguanylate cyclase [Lachnoclostridium phytofermentans]